MAPALRVDYDMRDEKPVLVLLEACREDKETKEHWRLAVALESDQRQGSSAGTNGLSLTTASCSKRQVDDGEVSRKRQPGGGAASGTDVDGQTELHWAAARGDVDKVRELLLRGFDPRAKDQRGWTPLHTALISSNEDAAELLADADGALDVRDGNLHTPLHIAAESGCERMARKLVAAGADTRLPDCRGRTPLHLALIYEKRAVAELLADADYENNIPDADGFIPLHYAVTYGNVHIVKRLLFGYADPHVKNGRGKYPLYEAVGTGSALVILQMYAMRDLAINWKEIGLPSRAYEQFCDSHLAEYRAEIEKMKSTGVGGSRVSYYDLARRSSGQVALYIANKGVREALAVEQKTLARDFPYYFELITFRVRLAEERRGLLERCRLCFTLVGRKLPPTCTDIVFLCLSVRDLRNVFCAFRTECKRFG
ncbi:ankyrin repeat and protein kinase domain-containing protein 1-like [Uloborus diversus]|uniref:ankyrin repeat and protein kinase domain-containing protein 1-like n=1 Tax=Uloborus diversus TaxID=327109 RepID=UPI0024095687|nr:ankyrin repeat and protein kinase domain-containing protein 1-like [Uloborus diversus]